METSSIRSGIQSAIITTKFIVNEVRLVKAKRTTKNSIFLDLFKDKKYLLALYKALRPEDTEDIINQYIIFCKVLDEQREKYGMTEQAIKQTIRICKDRNVLKEYLERKETEVVTIMMSLFDEEEIMKIYGKSERRVETVICKPRAFLRLEISSQI